VSKSGVRELADGSQVRRAFDRVFASTDPFDYPFRPAVEASLVFYPTEGYHLSQVQYAAVVAAAHATGEPAFFVSVVEYSGDWVERGQHWLCDALGYEAYRSIELTLENALYSASGGWGLVLSQEQHALVGGSREFVRRVQASYPAWQKCWSELLHEWAGNPNGSWLSKVENRITTA
jgi:hypothetical protein